MQVPLDKLIAFNSPSYTPGSCFWDSDEVNKVKRADPNFVFNSTKDLIGLFDFR